MTRLENSNCSELDKIVQVGCQITLEIVYRSGSREQLEFDLVPNDQADYQNGFLSASTPLGKTILNEKIGVLIPYFTDDITAVQINSIQPSIRVPNIDISTHRKSTMADIKDQIEFRNAQLFASSADTKWGNYDPDGLDFETWKSKQDPSK